MKTTALTEEMIDSFPAVDPHIHVPGTISPQTAWDLGLRNKLIHMEHDEDGKWTVVDGPNKIGESDPVVKYSNLFTAKGGHELTFDEKGKPFNLDYDYFCLPQRNGKHRNKFDGFDAIQGTTQGHRHRPGGIQNENDYRFVMQRFLESCLQQNIRYVEPSQNITIAQVLYPDLPPKEARSKFFHLCKEIVDDYATAGVTLRFTHCANKTGAANVPNSLHNRSLEWAEWLKQAHEETPGVFVGMTTAGNEKGEIASGGPEAMADAYHAVEKLGLGAEGHYGEGAGVEHLMRAVSSLKLDRLAHGMQMVESGDAMRQIKSMGIPIIMMPNINLSLGGVIHYKDGKPHAKLQRDAQGKFIIDPSTGRAKRVEGIENRYISRYEDHPFFPLMREHGLAIALASDDPQQAGTDYKDQAKELAGLTYKFDQGFKPLSAEELTLCNLNAVHAAFCESEVKRELVGHIVDWMKENKIAVQHPLLDQYKAQGSWKDAVNVPSAGRSRAAGQA